MKSFWKNFFNKLSISKIISYIFSYLNLQKKIRITSLKTAISFFLSILFINPIVISKPLYNKFNTKNSYISFNERIKELALSKLLKIAAITIGGIVATAGMDVAIYEIVLQHKYSKNMRNLDFIDKTKIDKMTVEQKMQKFKNIVYNFMDMDVEYSGFSGILYSIQDAVLHRNAVKMQKVNAMRV